MSDLSKKNKEKEGQEPYSHLIEGAKMGDKRSQREIYEKLKGKMFPVCIRYIGDRERAKDILQDGFITLFAKIKEYRGDGSFEGWARRVFATTALMQIRRRDILNESDQIDGQVQIADKNLEVKPPEGASVDADWLMDLILSMPEGFRVVFNLYEIEGYSHKEIAKMLGISEGSSRSQLSRAKIWLQKRLPKNGL